MYKVFFDSDCISAFLWTDSQWILTRQYSGRAFIPEAVYTELSNPTTPHLKSKADALIRAGDFCIEKIFFGTPEYRELVQLTQTIDEGEAAVIVLAKRENGIVASNNTMHVKQYINKYGLQHLTTAEIMFNALSLGIISEANGNQLWNEMKRKRRWLPTSTFSDYLISRAIP